MFLDVQIELVGDGAVQLRVLVLRQQRYPSLTGPLAGIPALVDLPLL